MSQNSFLSHSDRIVIVGPGLLGSSIGLGLKRAGYLGDIVGIGRDEGALARAVELGAIDRGATDLQSQLRGSCLIILATPLLTFGALLQSIASKMTAEMIVTDVGSAKVQVCQLARKILPFPQRFVGSHPMAGGIGQGPDAAREGLFAGRPCVMTPCAGIDPKAKAIVAALWEGLGMVVQEMDAEEHDKKVACISHLPHVIATALVSCADEQGAMSMASTGFRDTTRVASGNPLIWRDIFQTNRKAIMESIDVYTAKMKIFRQMLEDQEMPRILEELELLKEQRDQWVQGQFDGLKEQ